MQEISLAEQITYSTVLIRCICKDAVLPDKQYISCGTGFVMNLCINKYGNGTCVPVLITNKHVVKRSLKCSFSFCKKDKQGNPVNQDTVECTCNGENDWIFHPNNDVDLCCYPLVDFLKKCDVIGESVAYVALNTDLIPDEKTIEALSLLENVVMVGYPEGVSDEYNNKPIFRRGTTATHVKYDYMGKSNFLIDIATFHGSSGSPVFVLNEGWFHDGKGALVPGNRIYLLGVLWGVLETSKEGSLCFNVLSAVPKPVLTMPINLGIATKAKNILDFEKML